MYTFATWHEEMEALCEWTRLNWERTGNTSKAAGITATIDLGQGVTPQTKQTKKR